MPWGSSTSLGLPFALNTGDTISYNLPSWINQSANVLGADIEFYSIGTFGHFLGKDKFLGVKFYGPQETGIGWIRCEVDSQSNHITFKDYAYSTDTESPILAGQMFPTHVVDIQKPSGSFTYNKHQLNVTLKNLKNAELVVTNVLGDELIHQKVQEGENIISLPELTAGIYFIKLINGGVIYKSKFILN